jgi:hypothetical protein
LIQVTTTNCQLAILSVSKLSLPDVQLILPVDPMAWATYPETAYREMLLCASSEGVLSFWAPENDCQWVMTGRVPTGRHQIRLARCSSAKKTVLGIGSSILFYYTLIDLNQCQHTQVGRNWRYGILNSLSSQQGLSSNTFLGEFWLLSWWPLSCIEYHCKWTRTSDKRSWLDIHKCWILSSCCRFPTWGFVTLRTTYDIFWPRSCLADMSPDWNIRVMTNPVEWSSTEARLDWRRIPFLIRYGLLTVNSPSGQDIICYSMNNQVPMMVVSLKMKRRSDCSIMWISITAHFPTIIRKCFFNAYYGVCVHFCSEGHYQVTSTR